MAAPGYWCSHDVSFVGFFKHIRIGRTTMRRRLSRSAFTRLHISSPSVEKPPKTIKWTRGLRRGGWSVKLDTHRPAFCQLALSYWDGILKFAAQLDWISWIQQNGLGFHWFNQIWPCKTTWMGIPVWINANKCNICCFDFNMFLYFYCIKLMVWATESMPTFDKSSAIQDELWSKNIYINTGWISSYYSIKLHVIIVEVCLRTNTAQFANCLHGGAVHCGISVSKGSWTAATRCHHYRWYASPLHCLHITLSEEESWLIKRRTEFLSLA